VLQQEFIRLLPTINGLASFKFGKFCKFMVYLLTIVLFVWIKEKSDGM